MTLLKALEESGTKLTVQRRLIAEKIDRQKQAFSAEELHSQGLKTKGVDLATIYRTLNLLHKLNHLNKAEFGDRKSRYWLKSKKAHCQTFYCESCGRVENLDSCLVHSQHDQLKNQGYTQLTHRVEFIGICPQCSKTEGVVV
jgi:Fur family peroxide stress response transcriptional regulator